MTRQEWLRRARRIAKDDAELQAYLNNLLREVALRIHADESDATSDQVNRVAQALIETRLVNLVYGVSA